LRLERVLVFLYCSGTEIFGLSLVYVLAPLALFVAGMVFFIPVLARLFRQCHLSDITPEWLENFSPVSYRAMEDLLAEEDFEFLVRQPGFEASLSKKLRKDRIAIFRLYLNRLVSDFNRLHVYARYLISQSSEDQSSLLAQLVKLRLRFLFTVLRVEFILLLVRFGVQPRFVGQAIAHLNEMNGYLHAVLAA
jgi:hypothetical protein